MGNNNKKPNIVIDARLYGPKNTGIGRYTKNLLIFLTQTKNFNNYQYTLLINKLFESDIKNDLNENFNYISTNIAHYSWQEQIKLPFLLYKLKPDLVHFTHFNKPILYFGKSIVTVHDLIKHYFKGKDTTTKNQGVYWIKHLGYLIVSWFAIKTSYIIVPSNFWKEIIIKKFKINPKNIQTTYEAVDPEFIKTSLKPNPKASNYILYTGNLYPHKNISIIIQALKNLPNTQLKIICARNIFSNRIEKIIKQSKLTNQVSFLGYIDDSRFAKIYSNAIALVHPSLMEGFSLTGLEAMALNCPVISSNASCLPEIYGKSVLYFDPFDAQDLTNKIKLLQSSKLLRQELICLGKKQLQKYSWNKTAQKTLNIYRDILQ
jgi:glycosyltransferase involved in cell wall biosynthesis